MSNQVKHTPGPVQILARLSIQSERYQTDLDFREAVDNVLNIPIYDTASELLEACKRAFALIKESGFTSGLIEEEFDSTLHQLGDVIAKAEGGGD